jgi:hypothetical protein
MLKVGDLVRPTSTTDEFIGLVVEINEMETTPYQKQYIVQLTGTSEYGGKSYPFTKHQLEIISESS